MTSAHLRPIPFAIPFDIRAKTGHNADAANLQKQDGSSQTWHPPSSQAARQANCGSTVFLEQCAQEADTSALDQLQTHVGASDSGQQRTARQRLDFLSPPETPGTGRTSNHAGVADASITSSDALASFQDRPAASQSSTDAAPVLKLKASGGEATPLAAQAGTVGSQSGSPFEKQPMLESAQQEMAGVTGTAERPPPHGEAASGTDSIVGPSEARMLASDGPSIGQLICVPASVDITSPKGSRMAEVVRNAAQSATDTDPESESANVMKTDSLAGDASAYSSTQAVPDEHSQSAPESTLMPAITARAATGATSGPVHGVDGRAQEGLGATVIRSAMQGASDAIAESDENSVATHRPSDAAEYHEPSSTAGAEASQTGKCSSGSFPSPGLIGTQSSHSQKSDGALQLDDSQGASYAAAQSSDEVIQPTVAAEQAPQERTSEAKRGTVASASKAAPLPELVPQPSTTSQLDEQQTIPPGVESRGAHAIVSAAVEEPVEASSPLLHQLPSERSIKTAQPFSLPVPPPVPQFKRQHFSSSSEAGMPGSPFPSALCAASASGGVASSSLEKQLPVAGTERRAETEALVGDGSSVRESHATDTDLLALAEEVRRLELEVAAAQGAAEQACARADAAHADARSARAEAEEWREREADARSELAAIREAYTEVRGEAEAAKEELQQLQDSNRALHEQMATSLQQAHAVEGGKMSMRLEKAERAIEQERATVRDLQRALAAARQASPAASPRKDGGQARAALAAMHKELADTKAALEAQKLTNSGLQIRVTELLRAAKETEELRRTYVDLNSRSEAIQRREARTMELEAAVENLRAQNNALHVTMERLLGTNSELGNKVNSQAARISSMEAAVEEAHVSRPAPPAASEPAGGVRFSDTELELLALAEYVKELEAALEHQRALSSSEKRGMPAVSVSGPASSSEAVEGEADGARSNQQVRTAIPKPEGPADGEPVAAKVAEPHSPAQSRRQRVTWWGYITGADRATPVKSAS
ncbi:g7154 [Coccomyxa elongata]